MTITTTAPARSLARRRFVHGIGTLLAYTYVLRVPLLACLLLAAMPLVALPRDAFAGSLLRGLFDVVDPQMRWWAPAVVFALLTFASLMLAATIAITARLVLLDAEARFDLVSLPPSPGIQVVIRLLPVVAAAMTVAGALIQSWENTGPVAATAGIALGLAVFVLFMTTLHDWLWDELFVDQHTFTNARNPIVLITLALFGAFRKVVALTPEGFIEPRSGRVRARHAFALLQFVLSLVFYVGLLAAKSDWFPSGIGVPRIPTLCLLLVVAMLACWTLAGLTFVFDRYRVPLLTIVVTYGTLMSVFTWNDYFFQTTSREPGPPASLTADAILGQRIDRPAVVIAAAGGGIQAAAWTARVIAGLQQDSLACGDDFDEAIVAISSVSGGSVGAMYVLDAYRDGHLRDPAALDTAVKAAEASSLDYVAWGLTYPDLVWSIAPFFKGVHRPYLVKDRGSALEDAWKRTPTLATATLDRWRADVGARRRPAALFNATVAETGQRMLFATTTLQANGIYAANANNSGRREFAVDFPQVDVPVTTAARLSATFPYVSPAARINRYGGYDNQYHYVDGGYYDNYGTATAIEWIDDGLSRLGKTMPSRILILEIRSFPDGGIPPPDGRRGFTADALQPVATLYAVRGSGQEAHSDMNVHLLEDQYGGILVHNVRVTFPAAFGEDQDDQSPPLSWHLTPADRGRLAAAWHADSVYRARAAVHAFMRLDDAKVQNDCLAR